MRQSEGKTTQSVEKLPENNPGKPLFTSGLKCFIFAIKLAFHPKLRKYLLIPLLLNFTLFSLVLLWGFSLFSDLAHWLSSFLPEWLGFLIWLIWVLFLISSFFVISHTFALLTALCAAPFNSALSEGAEKVYREITYKTNFQPKSLPIFKNLLFTFKRESSKLFYFVPRLILLLILFFIPVINIIAPFTWLLFTAWMFALEFVDYPFENRNIDFKQTRKQLKQKPLRTLSFGSIIMIAFSIPFLNWFILPIAVIAGTLFYIEEHSI